MLNQTTSGGATVVSYGTPSGELLQKAAALMFKEKMKGGEKNAA